MEKPNKRLVWYLLKKRLIMNPEQIMTAIRNRKRISGLIQRPEIIPAHKGRPIRRNGISLCSTVRS